MPPITDAITSPSPEEDGERAASPSPDGVLSPGSSDSSEFGPFFLGVPPLAAASSSDAEGMCNPENKVANDPCAAASITYPCLCC